MFHQVSFARACQRAHQRCSRRCMTPNGHSTFFQSSPIHKASTRCATHETCCMNSFLGSSLILMSMASSQGGRSISWFSWFPSFLCGCFTIVAVSVFNHGCLNPGAQSVAGLAAAAAAASLSSICFAGLSCGRMHRPQGSKQQKVPAVSSVFIITI